MGLRLVRPLLRLGPPQGHTVIMAHPLASSSTRLLLIPRTMHALHIHPSQYLSFVSGLYRHVCFDSFPKTWPHRFVHRSLLCVPRALSYFPYTAPLVINMQLPPSPPVPSSPCILLFVGIVVVVISPFIFVWIGNVNTFCNIFLDQEPWLYIFPVGRARPCG